MKFVCEKCNTKYTIADEKVRRKVLKIRCKNCSSIIVVREPGAPSTEVPPVEEPERGGQGRALERAFDGAFNKGGRARRVSSAAQPLRMSPASAIASSDLIEEEAPSEQTRLSSIPDFLQESPSSGGAGAGSSSAASDDEWYLAVDTSQFGPMGFSELCSRVKRGETGAEAYVWRDGFDDWLEINDVPELKPYVPRHPPPPPRGRSGLFPVAASLPPLGGSPNIPPPVPPGNPYLQPMRQVPATIQQHPLPPRPASQVPTSPAHPAVSSLSSTYQPRPTMQTLPPGTAAPAPEPAHDSGLLNLLPTPAAPPAAMATAAGPPLEQYPAPAPAPMPPRASGGTPLLLKITAVAGVASLLCGIALVAYFIFFDRSDKQRPRVAIAPSLGDPAQVTPPAPVATPRPDSGGSFQPMEIERSPKGEKAPVAKHHLAARAASRPPAKAPAPSGPTLDEKQRALMALYGNKGDQPGGGPPSAAVTGRRPRGPVRQITPNDIQSMQRKHRGPLSACYERALKRDDSLAELKAEVTVTISDEGAVKGVSISGAGNDDLANCLRKDIRTWVFDPMGEQTFKFPIIFRGS